MFFLFWLSSMHELNKQWGNVNVFPDSSLIIHLILFGGCIFVVNNLIFAPFLEKIQARDSKITQLKETLEVCLAETDEKQNIYGHKTQEATDKARKKLAYLKLDLQKERAQNLESALQQSQRAVLAQQKEIELVIEQEKQALPEIKKSVTQEIIALL